MISATTCKKIIRIHLPVDENFEVRFKDMGFLKSIVKSIKYFLNITRDNLTSTSVKVVPLIVTST